MERNFFEVADTTRTGTKWETPNTVTDSSTTTFLVTFQATDAAFLGENTTTTSVTRFVDTSEANFGQDTVQYSTAYRGSWIFNICNLKAKKLKILWKLMWESSNATWNKILETFDIFNSGTRKTDTTFNKYSRIRHFFPNSCAV